MRQVPTDLQASLDSGTTTLCRCWQLVRRDGRVMGFTDHDLDIAFGGVIFSAGTGLDPSMLQTSIGLAVDNAQAAGALSDASISEADIRAGRYDSAEIDHWIVDWTDPSRRVHMFRGQIGEIRRSDTHFEAELRGLADLLNVLVGRTIKRSCDRVLGDERCRVDLADGRYLFGTSVDVAGRGGNVTLAEPGGFEAGWFSRGLVRWVDGRNEGLTSPIQEDRLADGTRTIQLAAEPPFMPERGDRLDLVAGCDKQATTCRAKFDNFLNFRGFPHIPGEDWVLAYPRKGQRHDGSSLKRS
jgi:uncharacterized phage protein (TIGR02218 family)